MRVRYWIAFALAVLFLALLAGWASNRAAQTANDFQAFRSSICALSAGQEKQSAGFIRLLQTLDTRAIAREHVDATAGNATAAAADADSARLYETVLVEYQHPPAVHLDC